MEAGSVQPPILVQQIRRMSHLCGVLQNRQRVRMHRTLLVKLETARNGYLMFPLKRLLVPALFPRSLTLPSSWCLWCSYCHRSPSKRWTGILAGLLLSCLFFVAHSVFLRSYRESGRERREGRRKGRKELPFLIIRAIWGAQSDCTAFLMGAEDSGERLEQRVMGSGCCSLRWGFPEHWINCPPKFFLYYIVGILSGAAILGIWDSASPFYKLSLYHNSTIR